MSIDAGEAEQLRKLLEEVSVRLGRAQAEAQANRFALGAIIAFLGATRALESGPVTRFLKSRGSDAVSGDAGSLLQIALIAEGLLGATHPAMAGADPVN